MWKKLTLIAAIFSVAMFLVMPLAATGDKPDSPPGQDKKEPPPEPPEPVPGGPGLIAFNDAGVIALMNPDGSGWTPVAAAQTSSEKPGWSPMFSDETVKLAYPAWDADTYDSYLMVVNVFSDGVLDIGEPVSVLTVIDTPSSGGLYQVDWSPTIDDGTERVRVSYATWKDWDVPDSQREVIHVVELMYDPDTGTFTVGSEPLVVDPGPGADYWKARFSPDGLWLALDRNDTLPDGSTHRSIWLANSDGTNQHELIDGPGSRDRDPAWSPDLDVDTDGYQGVLAFASDRDADRTGKLDIYVYRFDGSIERVTATKREQEWYLTWSPDGLQIAYSFSGNNRRQIGKIILATGERFSLGDGSCPDWSPMDLPPLP